jgi:hypothetical protein
MDRHPLTPALAGAGRQFGGRKRGGTVRRAGASCKVKGHGEFPG